MHQCVGIIEVTSAAGSIFRTPFSSNLGAWSFVTFFVTIRMAQDTRVPDWRTLKLSRQRGRKCGWGKVVRKCDIIKGKVLWTTSCLSFLVLKGLKVGFMNGDPTSTFTANECARVWMRSSTKTWLEWICLAWQHQEHCQRSNHHHHLHGPQSLPYFALVIPSLKVKLLLAKGLQIPLVRSDTPARHNKGIIHDLWSPTFACDIITIIVPPRRMWCDSRFNISVYVYTYHIILLYSCPYCWGINMIRQNASITVMPPFNPPIENVELWRP